VIAKNLNNNEVSEILALVKDKKKVDFSDYQLATIFQQLSRRVQLVDCSTLSEYYHYLLSKPEEIEQLFDFLTINVSHFFRNPLTYEFIDKAILHEIISNKIHRNDGQLRIWSASRGRTIFHCHLGPRNFRERTSGSGWQNICDRYR